MRYACCGTAAVLVAASMAAGCFGSPAARTGGSIAGLGHKKSGPFADPRLGPYPPPPRARRLRVHWEKSARPSWRTVWRTSYTETDSPAGRLSLDLDGSMFTYVRATADRRSRAGLEPGTLVLSRIGGAQRVIARARPGNIIEGARLSPSWVVWVERGADRVGDWTLIACRMPEMRRRTIARADSRLREKQFAPNVSLEGDLLAWDQRVATRRGPANAIFASDLRTGRKQCVDGPGQAHSPAIAEGTVFWNEETIRSQGGKIAVRSDIFAATPGGRERRLTRTGFAMFASAHGSTLAWVDMRRNWLNQPAIADVYCRLGAGPVMRVTDHGLTERVLAGKDILVWQVTPGRVCALDTRTSRAYRLAGWASKEAVLWDVDEGRVAYELQPNPFRNDNAYELVIAELKTQE